MTEDFSLNWGPRSDPNAPPKALPLPPGAHYGLKTPLLLPLDHDIPMRGHKLANLALGTEPKDSVSLRQLHAAIQVLEVTTRRIVPKTVTGTIVRNSHGLAIVHKGPQLHAARTVYTKTETAPTSRSHSSS